jgi:hypothetical protein
MRRARWIFQIAAILALLAPAETPALADGCPAGTVQIGQTQEETADEIIIHPICKRQKPVPVKPTAEECDAAERQAEQDRTEIERNKGSTEFSQEELAAWTAQGKKAQVETLKAGVVYVLGRYAEDVDSVDSAVSKLEKQASTLAKKMAKAKDSETRYEFLSKLNDTKELLRPMQVKQVTKGFSEFSTNVEKGFGLVRNTMYNQFRVAAKHNARLKEILNDPEYKDAFTGDDLDTPIRDVVTSLTETALENSDKLAAGLEDYGSLLGPTVKTVAFVRDVSYNAWLFSVSLERVRDQSSVAGQFARASAALQKQYKKTIDTLHACHAAP